MRHFKHPQLHAFIFFVSSCRCTDLPTGFRYSLKLAAMSLPESPTRESSGPPTRSTPKKTRYCDVTLFHFFFLFAFFVSRLIPRRQNLRNSIGLTASACSLISSSANINVVLVGCGCQVGVFVSIVSTKIPFKGTSKEYIGEDIEPMAEAVNER